MVISSFKACFFSHGWPNKNIPWAVSKAMEFSLVVIKNIEVCVSETSSVMKCFCSETFLTHFSYGTQPKYETR